MSDYFAFRFNEPDDTDRRSLVIFIPAQISLDVISKVLKQDVTENLVPKKVYLISLPGSSITHQDCLEDVSFVREFDSYVGEIKNQLLCLSVDMTGSLAYCDGNPMTGKLSGAILQSGMIALFKKHSGLVVSNHGYHFVKPSGDHCNKFIRASNLLVSGVEVTFLAVSLLPYMRRDLKRIYVDTSSISFLISLAIQLYREFDYGMPSIESFASYAVLNEPFDFVEDKSSLLLISATTSGSLAKKLLDKNSFDKDQVITLFHVNLPIDQKGVFDVSEALNGALISKKVPECEFCKRGSKLIRIAGDQFLPENPKHELLVIKKTDFDRKRQEFFKQFAATNVLRWNVAVRSVDEEKEHFYLDVKTALESKAEPFLSALDRSLKKYITRDLKTVIFFDDDGSRALKDKVKEYFVDGSKAITWLTNGDLDQTALQDSASVMVLAGAITSGRSLLAVSRKLRCLHQSATITYLVAFSKMPSNDAYKQLEKDLTQGGHNLVVLNHCSVPRIKEYIKTAWDSEREFLRPLGASDPFGNSDQTLPEKLSKRRESLLEDSLNSDEIFLPDCEGRPLNLRRTFAFWSDLGFTEERLKLTRQSDVYWTLQTVIHDLRNGSENNGLATPYHTTLVSPANFDRYNDGLIQACLLRAAYPVEMDYRVDAVFSRQMTDVILSVLRNWNNEQGEAVLEFLSALCTKRLCVNEEHVKEIVRLKNETMPEELRFMLERLSE